MNGILLIFRRPFAFRDASTIREHIGSFQRHSKFPVRAVNTAFGFPGPLLKHEFDVILLHYTLFAGIEYGLDKRWLEYIDGCRGSYKVAFFQDEYFGCPKRFAFLRDHGIDCVYTLLDETEAPKVYGDIGGVGTVVSTLPGYVSSDMVKAAHRFALPDPRRTVDIGYRSRPLSAFMGRAAWEKTGIAHGVRQRCDELGMPVDIETDERSRLYGNDWYRFLGRCRACIGVEAGVSVFDLEGVVYQRYRELRAAHPGASFDEMVQLLAPVMDPWEDRVYYRTISPRHFETAAFGACQILFEGRYSGILEPGRHYIPLAKDFSNLDDVLRRFRDPAVRREIVHNAHHDLIASDAFSYRRFVQAFDWTLAREGVSPRGSIVGATRIRLMSLHPEVLPRILKPLAFRGMGRVYRWTQQSRIGQKLIQPLAGRLIDRFATRWKDRRERRNGGDGRAS